MKKSIRVFVILCVIAVLPGLFQGFNQGFGSKQGLGLISLVSAQTRIPVDTETGTKDVFVSGMNLAWIDFANDNADSTLNENKMRKSIQDLRDAGGNSMRWWLFTNAAYAPKFGSDNLVSGLGTKSIDNVVKALDIAQENGIVVSLCLLSFDLLQEGSDKYWEFIIERNKKMITTDEGIQALIDNAIIPLVQGVGDHPAIMTWEIFNEPEGMSQEFGWTTEKVTMRDVQKMTNRIAGAINRVTGIPVSIGSHSMYASSDVPDCDNCKNYYSDAELIAAGGEQNGTLDFMQVHFYPEHFEDDRNPFAHPALYWNIGKPIVIGEFPAGDWHSGNYKSSGMTNEAAFRYAYDNGYAGAMSWDMNGFKDDVNPSYIQNLETSTAGLGYLWENHQEDILIKEITRNSTDNFFILTESSPNITITSGKDNKIYGTATSNQITLESGANAELVNFTGFNTIQFQSGSDMFTVFRTGTLVTFQGTDGTVLKIPATTDVQTIDFTDRDPLILSIHDNKVMLDDQEINLNPVAISTTIIAVLKPIIYLYPESIQEIYVAFEKPDSTLLTTTYPEYSINGWNVLAYPDGTLYDNETGLEFYALYWEGLTPKTGNYEIGFVIKSEDSATFLETSLEQLGLSRREANEFIVYWLPELEKSQYNFIHFSTEDWEKDVPLEIIPEPETLIRFMMYYQPLEYPIQVEPQVLKSPVRKGFTVVEWGGGIIE